MANIVNFSTYGFLDDILALNEDNWRNFFKPIVYDSVQGGLEVTAGTGMTVNVSAGECRCGSIMGISNSQMSLDINVGDNTYSRIDSVVIQYTYGDPSLLSVAVLQGEPSASPVAPTLTKSYNSLWQMEIAQILVPPNVTTTAECTITDKRIIYNSIDSVIDPINESIDDINNEIQDINEDIENIDKNKLDNGAVAPVFSETLTYAIGDVVSYQGRIYKFKSSHSVGVWNSSEVDEITTWHEKVDNSTVAPIFSEIATYVVGDIVTYNGKLYKFTSSHSAGSWNSSEVTEITTWYEKADNGAVAPVFSEIATYAVDDCVMYQGKLYKFLSAHSPGPWVGGNEVVETNALAQSGGGGGSGGVGDEITFNDSNSAMIITSSNRSINSLESAVAIVSTGDTHPRIEEGQYVYVKLHMSVSGLADLPEGLYVANSEIGANVALTTTNLSSVSGGGLNALQTQADKLEVLVVDCGTISSIPATINTGSALNVESDMVVLQSTFGNPSAATSNWTVSTYDGYLVVGSGTGETISGSTSLILYLMKSR